MYYINEAFLREVHRLFDMTQKQFSFFALNSHQLWPQRLTYFDRLLVDDLIKIANATQIPVRYFFSTKPEGEKFFTLDSIRIDNDWKIIEPNMEGLKRIYKAEYGTYKRQELLEHIKIDSSCFWRWLNGKVFKMRAQQACDICNRFGIDMGEIIKDTNAAFQQAPGMKDIDNLANENAVLKEHLNNQSEQMKDILSAVASLKTSIASRANVMAHASNTVGMVTEDEDIYAKPKDVWTFNASEWPVGDYPTISSFIAYCNTGHYPTLPFLRPINYVPENEVDNSEFKMITLDFMAYKTLAKSVGISIDPDDVRMDKFLATLNECDLTPACCINDPNSPYNTHYPDRLLRAVGNTGLTV